MLRPTCVKICPVCASSELYYELGGYMGYIYHCKKCGYSGPFVIEANEKLREELKKEYNSTHQRENKNTN
jgi:transposase-like protein